MSIKNEFGYYSCGDIVTVSLNVWIKFLEDNEELMISLWDLIPPNLKIISVDPVPYHNGGPLYAVTYKGFRFWLYEEDLILVEEE